MAIDNECRVLIVVDQPLIADMVVFTLNHGVYDARIVTTIAEAKSVIEEWGPHLLVIDMDLGNSSLIERLGIADPGLRHAAPILALTRRGDLKTKLAAFEQGVEDIMTVPFSPEELLARAIALTRRAHGSGPDLKTSIRIGEMEIDILNREVRAGTSVLHLTSLEQALLYLLAANAGKVLNREEIMDALWGVDFIAESNVVDRHIRSLRAKLQNDWRKPRFIDTVPGHGYRFIPTFTDSARAGAQAS